MSATPEKRDPFPEVDRQAGELTALRRALLASRGTFSLSVAVCNSPALRDHLIARLQSEHEGLHVVEVPEKTEDVYAVVCEKTQGSSPWALFVTNLEKSLPSSDQKPVRSPVLRRLNGTRELWKQQHPYPVVFWVPEYVAGMLASGARDLWAWRSHQFEFVAERLEFAVAVMPMFTGGLSMAANLDQDSKRFRIAELEQRIGDAGEPLPAELVPHAFAWLQELGHLLYIFGELDQAENTWRRALALAERVGRQEGVAMQYGNLGLIYQARGKLEDAEAMHRKALDIDERLGRHQGMACEYGNLGEIYLARGDLDGAEAVVRKSLEIDERLGHLEGLAIDYSNLGVIYWRRGELNQAESMYRKALDIDEKLGHVEAMAAHYGNLGVLSGERGDLVRAEAMHRKALELYESLGVLEGMAKQYGNLGIDYSQRGDVRAARECWTKARDLYARIGVPHKVEKVQAWIDELE